jgi:hypothetical protein
MAATQPPAQWRRVRAQPRAFEETLEDILARGEDEGVFRFDEIADGMRIMFGAAGRSDE